MKTSLTELGISELLQNEVCEIWEILPVFLSIWLTILFIPIDHSYNRKHAIFDLYNIYITCLDYITFTVPPEQITCVFTTHSFVLIPLFFQMVTAAIRANYNQDITDVSAFVGFVSLAGGLVGSLWSVKGGNFLLPEKILSGLEVVKTEVKSIQKLGDGRFTVSYSSPDNDDVTSEEFDVVVLATPVHNADITLPDEVTIPPQQYQRTVATFVNGLLAPVVPGEENPHNILVVTSKEEIIFSSIAFKGDGKPGRNYKVFSKAPLTDSEIKRLFSKVNEVQVVDWLAYPKYSVPNTLPDFELIPGLYHINAIESAASAIEFSCIGAKNVALLVYQYLENVENVDPVSVCHDMKKYKNELWVPFKVFKYVGIIYSLHFRFDAQKVICNV